MVAAVAHGGIVRMDYFPEGAWSGTALGGRSGTTAYM